MKKYTQEFMNEVLDMIDKMDIKKLDEAHDFYFRLFSKGAHYTKMKIILDAISFKKNKINQNC